VPLIARLVQTSRDRVREVIHNFNRLGMECLDPKWANGRPRRISPDDEAFIVETATTRPEKLGLPFTRWSIRKLAQYLAANPAREVQIGRERLREILAEHKVTFQRTKTWKESNDPARDAKLDRIEYVMEHHLDRCFAFDEFGPLAIHPVAGFYWARHEKPRRNRTSYYKRCGVRQFHAVHSLGDDISGASAARRSRSPTASPTSRAAGPPGPTASPST
jgi:transposase